jgi:hypothetical protein
VNLNINHELGRILHVAGKYRISKENCISVRILDIEEGMQLWNISRVSERRLQCTCFLDSRRQLTYLDVFLLGVEWNRVHYYRGHYWPTAPAPDNGDDAG